MATKSTMPKENYAKDIHPLNVQVGGDHYKKFKIQPIEFVMANGLDACQAAVIKYIMRSKGDKTKRIEDLNKAKHYIDLMINFESTCSA